MSKDRSPLELLSALAITFVAGFLSASLLWMYADHVEQKAREAQDDADAATGGLLRMPHWYINK